MVCSKLVNLDAKNIISLRVKVQVNALQKNPKQATFFDSLLPRNLKWSGLETFSQLSLVSLAGSLVQLLTKDRSFHCTGLLRSRKLIHVVAKSVACFTQNLMHNLKKLTVAYKNNKKSPKNCKSQTFFEKRVSTLSAINVQLLYTITF